MNLYEMMGFRHYTSLFIEQGVNLVSLIVMVNVIVALKIERDEWKAKSLLYKRAYLRDIGADMHEATPEQVKKLLKEGLW